MGAIAPIRISLETHILQGKTNDVSERCVRHNSTINIIIDPV